MSLTKIKTFFKVLLIVVLVIAVCGCTSPITIGRKTSDAINVYPAMVELPVGETLILQILTGSGNEENMDVEWNSSDEQIATVSEDGRVTAIAAGEAFVDASAAGDERRKSSCRIVVKEDGPILLFSVDDLGNGEQNSTSGSQTDSGSPNLPGGGSSQGESETPDTPGESQGETGSGDETGPGESEQGETGPSEVDEQIPMEQESGGSIPDGGIPKTNQYIWTIRVNDTIEEDVGDSMKVIYKLNLNAKKEGGKNCRGAYRGRATFEIKVDTGDLTEGILENAEVLKKFDINVGVKYSADDVSFDVINYNPSDFYRYGSGSNNVEIVPLVPDSNVAPPQERSPVVSLVPMSGMACDYMEVEGSGSFGASSLDIEDIGIDMDKDIGSSGIMIYKMSITPVGRIELQVPDIKSSQRFKGQLSRKPVYPD